MTLASACLGQLQLAWASVWPVQAAYAMVRNRLAIHDASMFVKLC